MTTDSAKQLLWAAVIAQAFDDACAKLPYLPSTGLSGATAKQRAKWRAASRERDEARAWLLSDPDDYYTVCTLAGVDATIVRAQADALSFWDWPAPANGSSYRELLQPAPPKLQPALAEAA